MDDRSVTVGVVNYNGSAYLSDTLSAVERLGGSVGEVLLADNASTDGSTALVRERFPKVRVLALTENRGPGCARNALIEAATRDRLLLIDNDVAPLPGAVEALTAALDLYPSAVLAMPAVLLGREPDLIQYIGADAHFLGTMALRQAGTPAAALNGRVDRVSSVVSACLLLDRRRLGNRARFEESYFLYLEDHEFGLRCRLIGFDLLVVPSARCLHGDGSIGISLRQTGRFTSTRVRYTILNRWRTILSLYQGRTLLRFAPALASFEIMQLAAAVRMGWVGDWLWSTRQLVREFPALRRRRRAFARERRVPDLDVLAPGPFPFNESLPRSWPERFARHLMNLIADVNWRLAGAR